MKVWRKMPLVTEEIGLQKGLFKNPRRVTQREHWIILCLLLVDNTLGVKTEFNKKEYKALKTNVKLDDFTKFVPGKSWRHWCNGRHLRPFGDSYKLEL